MKNKILLSLYLIHSTCCGSEVLSSFLNNYTRPITLLYISENPSWLNVREQDVLVYWTRNKAFIEEITFKRPKNCIVISTPIKTSSIKKLTTFERFDVTIADEDLALDISDITNTAFHIFLLNDSFTYMAGNSGPFNAYSSKVYSMQSTFHKRTIENDVKWVPGISVRTFFRMRGIYPNLDWIITRTLESYNPLHVSDFAWRNIILQGKEIQNIDYKVGDIHEYDEYFSTKKLLTRFKRYKFFSPFM